MPNDKTPLLRVFLVDDETLIRTGMKKLLDWESLGFTVIGEAENGRDALPQILSLSPHLVLTDLKMPFVGGLELARQVAAQQLSVRQTEVLARKAQAERARKSAQAQNEHSRKPQGGAARKQAGAAKPKGDFRPGRAHRAEVARQHSKRR